MAGDPFDVRDGLMQQLDAEVALSPGFRWGTSVLPGETITMERLLDQTCLTYPETYMREMSGAELKLIMESVADNLFNPDPYYQQGGDMVRTGGLSYTCEPAATMGNRITEMKLRNGRSIEENRSYQVAGWATVGARSPGKPVWDLVADYLRDRETISLDRFETPDLKGVSTNPGIADYAGKLD